MPTPHKTAGLCLPPATLRPWLRSALKPAPSGAACSPAASASDDCDSPCRTPRRGSGPSSAAAGSPSAGLPPQPALAGCAAPAATATPGPVHPHLKATAGKRPARLPELPLLVTFNAPIISGNQPGATMVTAHVSESSRGRAHTSRATSNPRPTCEQSDGRALTPQALSAGKEKRSDPARTPASWRVVTNKRCQRLVHDPRPTLQPVCPAHRVRPHVFLAPHLPNLASPTASVRPGPPQRGRRCSPPRSRGEPAATECWRFNMISETRPFSFKRLISL